MAKDEEYRRLINTARWRRLRHRVLSERPLCERCSAEGFVQVATEVHHITPVESGRTSAEKARLMYNPLNLRALCHRCHVLTHTEIGRNGKALARSRREAEVQDFTARYLSPGGVFEKGGDPSVNLVATQENAETLF